MKKVRLDKEEYTYLQEKDFFSQVILKNINTEKKSDNVFIVILPEDAADELRDLLGEQLQIYGFDENYEVTKEGMMLENLIDKFFIG